MKKSDIFWQTYLNLEKEAIEVSKYVFFTDEVLVNSKGKLITQSCNAQSFELTEDNIQSEIDSMGTRMGVQIMSQYQKFEWIQMAMNSEICKVYIPQ